MESTHVHSCHAQDDVQLARRPPRHSTSTMARVYVTTSTSCDGVHSLRRPAPRQRPCRNTNINVRLHGSHHIVVTILHLTATIELGLPAATFIAGDDV